MAVDACRSCAATTTRSGRRARCSCCSATTRIRRQPAAHRADLRERWDGFTYAWRHLPIGELHPNANGAALAAEGAAAQDAFWAYHHVLLARQDALSVPDLLNYAGQIGLEVSTLMEDMLEGRHAERVLDDVRSAVQLGRAGDAGDLHRGRALGGRLGAGRAGGRAACSPGRVRSSRSGRVRSRSGFAALLTRQAAWRHRRVETITVLSHEQVRRRGVGGLHGAGEHRDDVRLSDGEWVVPLALLAKRQLVHFDLRAEDETAVPLLRSDEAQPIARELLYLMLDLDRRRRARRSGALIERVLAAGPDEADDGRARRSPTVERSALPGFAALGRAAHARVPAVRGARTTWRAGA